MSSQGPSTLALGCRLAGAGTVTCNLGCRLHGVMLAHFLNFLSQLDI